jgi:hypothetical protein
VEEGLSIIDRAIVRRRISFVTLVATFAVLICAGQASAGTDAWFYASPLGATRANASTQAHSISYVYGNTNHNNFCVSKQTGYTGDEDVHTLTSSPQACSVSGGVAYRNENSACCYHGWIGNFNGFGISVAQAYYNY